MSYILDALSKSDAERQREQPPNLKSVHRSPGTRRRRGLDLWQLAIVVLVAGNLILLLLWLRSPAVETEMASPPERALPPETAAPRRDEGPLVEQPRESGSSAVVAMPASSGEHSVPATDSREEIITPPPQREAMPHLAEATLPTIAELPESIQRTIPDLSFASHIYSSSPQSRLVSINGALSREGDSIAPGLTLLGITEDGVVLEWRGTRFRMSVLRDWSFR